MTEVQFLYQIKKEIEEIVKDLDSEDHAIKSRLIDIFDRLHQRELVVNLYTNTCFNQKKEL